MGNPSAAEIADVGGDDAYRELLHMVRSVLLTFFPVAMWVTVNLIPTFSFGSDRILGTNQTQTRIQRAHSTLT